jgi:hypothetical protein
MSTASLSNVSADNRPLLQNLETITIGGIAGVLAASPNLGVVLWDKDGSVGRQFKELAGDIDAIFSSGISDDPRAKRVATGLAEALRGQNFDYLFGMQVAIDGQTAVLTPYILATVSGLISRPFEPLVNAASASFLRPVEQAGVKLRTYLLPKATRSESGRAAVGISCVIADPQSASANSKLAADLQAELLRRLNSEKVHVDLAAPGLCATRSLASKPLNDGSFKGVVSALMFGYRKSTYIQPQIWLRDAGDRVGPAINLRQIVRDRGNDQAVISNFVRQVANFWTLVVRSDGSVPEIQRGDVDTTLDKFLDTVDGGLQKGDVEQIAFLSYQLLSSDPGNSLGHYVLARSLLSKGDSLGAAEELVAVDAGNPRRVAPRLREGMGTALSSVGLHKVAINFLEDQRTEIGHQSCFR